MPAALHRLAGAIAPDASEGLFQVAWGDGLTRVGLDVAAKSIFRWRDLEADPGAVQHLLLGTLASIAVAVLDGLWIRHVTAR